MKISIVTISYNQAEFLEKAILSVINQDYNDIEYIIVDPGSTDGSRDIISKYRDRISEVIFESDEGPSDGLNKGFFVSHGEILGFLNSDDILLPGVLKEVADAFNKYSDFDVISGHCIFIDKDDHFIRKGYSERYSLLLAAYGCVVLIQPSTFFRRNVFFNSGGFNNKNQSSWDGELFVDLAMGGAQFAIANKFWSGYRLHSKSITGSKRKDEAIREYSKYIFYKIMKREQQQYDNIIGFVLRLFKHIRNPRALCERISKGPIYNRSHI